MILTPSCIANTKLANTKLTYVLQNLSPQSLKTEEVSGQTSFRQVVVGQVQHLQDREGAESTRQAVESVHTTRR